VTAPRSTVVRVGRAVGRFAESRRATPAVFLASLAVYASVSLALPLQAGRDLPRYLLHYGQLFDAHVVFPHALLTRTPGTPLVTGLLLDAGPFLSELGAGVLYALSVVAWFCVARRFGPLAALVMGVALLTYPGYVLLFHQLGSDALFAAAFALVALLLARAIERPTAGSAAALGIGVAAAVYARPVGQVLLLLGLAPFLAARGRRLRLEAGGAFAVAALVPLVALAGHNAVRGEDFTVVRGGSASLLFRTFVTDRIVEPGNGNSSAELARAVERQLLPNEPYQSRGIDLETFFSSGSSRMHDDFTVLADRTWGWDDDYRHLGRAAREAILAHPTEYARGVTRDLWRLLLWPLYAPVEEDAASPPGPASLQRTEQAAAPPPPPDPELIPSSREAPYISTPDGRIREVWTSPDAHAFVFRDPADRVRAAALDQEVNELLGALPERGSRASLVDLLNDLSRIYPRPFMWLLLGLAASLWRRPRGIGVPAVLAASGLLVLGATSLAVYAVAEYSVPVVPAFVLLAAVGLFGPRSARAPRVRRLRSRVGHARSAPRSQG
jgi:Dolichyl-phosphate-mannose-protein mannosyltransferase